MIVTFSYPSTARFGGGLDALFGYADGLARRGHEVHLVHGPAFPERIDHPDEITWHRFHPAVVHHVVDRLDDPSLPDGDIAFQPQLPRRVGQPVEVIQGYKLLAARYERPAFRAACPKLCVAGWLTDVGRAWGSPPEQLWWVPPGIEVDRFATPVGSVERPIDVAMLYSDHPVKGGADGLAALAEVRRTRPDLHVVLFGGVPSGPVPEWAEFRLGLDRDALAAEVYRRAKVFVQASWREGFGLTAVEAMVAGAALVTTDNGGSRDYARHDETALVVPPRSPAELAAGVAALLDDEDRRHRLARAGTDLAATFTWDRAAERLEGHLVDYLADPPALQHPPADAPMFLEETW
ncbi:MAG: glycosyltransferase family 4 protein [Acidimicrobiales bacterium]